jgi:SNF family Na+-dependent transporter
MAGNAVGLGNFLRFPVQAAQNGGGTFMIPYFISFLLLGIPLMWVEWGIGRYGGRQGHGTVPGMFDLLTGRKTKWAKYIGVLGIVMPLVVFIYYTYVVSWMLGFSLFSLTGDYQGLGSVEDMRAYLSSYQTLGDSTHHPAWIPLLFFFVTIAFLAWVLARGVSGGIEKLALYGMPVLFVFAFVLMARVLTLPAHEASPAEGLNFIWHPDWSGLGNARVWLAAAGQMFFTLSVGMGSIHTYASYLKRKDDVTLTGLSTASTNEFAEVVLGGTIAIPAAVVFFGVAGAMEIANRGAYDLGIVAMGVVFQGLPGAEILGRLAGFLWYFLLFIAGVTSCVALASPAIAFLQDEFRIARKKAAWAIAGLGLVLGLYQVVYYNYGVLSEWDFWAGTFGLVVFATLEILLFAWVFGIDKAWEELHHGAELRIPVVYRYIMKWVTPLFLLVLLGIWSYQLALPTIRMDNVPAENVTHLWVARLLMLGLVVAGMLMIRKAWRMRRTEEIAEEVR